ncbi:hypothetical protein G3H63_08550 [Microbacterium resistens]|uniref:hypothetical protein n=1 Tax=Microbacterium resistens TaxID=156977 RepID=UPI001C56C59A|nr:hypothetical protein [Microbacterium resistens]MBW1639122.1 hypothetical protein [Microbacterium resistens]
MAGSQYVDRGENVVGSCRDLPTPEDAAPVDNALRQASLTAVPAGILCEWDRAGGGTVSVQTGWPTTVAGLAGSVLLVVFTAAALRWPGAGRRFVTVIPLALGTALWIVVFLSVHTVAA